MSEKLLIVGSGGREHAIATAANDSATVYACGMSSTPGIREAVRDFRELDPCDPSSVVEYAEAVEATAAIIGPESVLEAGVVDALDDAGIYAFGPSQSDARIETDKAYQRQFLTEHDISGCPDFEVFDSVELACDRIEEAENDLVVKPAGLTGGKGVRVIGDQVTPQEAKDHLRRGSFEQVVLEERLQGEEYTIHAFVANGSFTTSPAIQDHNHAFEGDEGPSTGGMGTYHGRSNELPFMTREEYDSSVEIMHSVIDHLDEYKGFLCGQFMITDEGPMLVEFNARFGDPEALNIFPIMETDLVSVVCAARDGRELPAVEFEDAATVVKYAVPEGYPADPTGGKQINGLDGVDEETNGLKIFHGDIDQRDGRLYTGTSRSFGLVGIAEEIEQAEEIVSDGFSQIDLDGLRVRHDIGTSALVERRKDRMNRLRRE